MAKPRKLPSGRWHIRWIDADGVRQSRTLATFEQARAELRRLEVEVDDTKIQRERDPSAALTVAQAYAAHKATNKRAPGETERRFTKRWTRLDSHYEHHIAPHLADVLLADLTQSRLRAWIDTLAETKTARPGETGKRTLSAATIRAIVTSLSQTVKANDVPFQVLLPKSMKQKKRRTRPKAFQSIGEVRAFLAAAGRDPWFKVAAAIACYCGARLGEVASLRWRNIGADTVTLASSWEGPLKARYEDDGEGPRVVPLDGELAEILAAWRKLTNGGDDDRVVLHSGKRPLVEDTDTDLARRTRRACKRAGVTPLTFHELRASYATIVADQGLPVTRLSALLGHADIATTARYVRPESTHAAMDPRARIGGNVLVTPSSEPAAVVN